MLSFRQVTQRLPSTALPLALALPLMDTADWLPHLQYSGCSLWAPLGLGQP